MEGDQPRAPRLWASLEVTQRGPGLGWEGALQRARKAGGRAGVGLNGRRTHTYTLRAVLGDRCENIWDRRWPPSLYYSSRPSEHTEPEVVWCVCAPVCARPRAGAYQSPCLNT